MAQTFDNASAQSIGTTRVDVMTATQKTVVVGCNVANVTSFDLPISVSIVHADNSETFLIRNERVAGFSSKELIKGKVVVKAGEKIAAISGLDNSFDAVVSFLTGVA